jgi:enoyl-CoA hydratase/carnithine racemase
VFMPYDGFERLKVTVDGRVAVVTLDHPPINLLDVDFMRELSRVARDTAADPTLSVIVFRSANPEFFMAHADIRFVQTLPREAPTSPVTELEGLPKVFERWRTCPHFTIAQIEGCCRGGGSEFALSLDVRIAAVDRAVFGQPEVALGIIPGATGTQRLTALLGRSRALEVIIGCEDVSAEQAARLGWVNRAVSAESITSIVDALAARVAGFPPHAVRLAKQAVLAIDPDPAPALLEEASRFQQALADPSTEERLGRAMALGWQTPQYERDLGTRLEELATGS